MGVLLYHCYVCFDSVPQPGSVVRPHSKVRAASRSLHRIVCARDPLACTVCDVLALVLHALSHASADQRLQKCGKQRQSPAPRAVRTLLTAAAAAVVVAAAVHVRAGFTACAGVECNTPSCTRHPAQWTAMQMFFLSSLPPATQFYSTLNRFDDEHARLCPTCRCE